MKKTPELEVRPYRNSFTVYPRGKASVSAFLTQSLVTTFLVLAAFGVFYCAYCTFSWDFLRGWEGPVYHRYFSIGGTAQAKYILAGRETSPVAALVISEVLLITATALRHLVLTRWPGHLWHGGDPITRDRVGKALLIPWRNRRSPIVAAAVSDLGAALLEWDRTRGSRKAKAELGRCIDRVEAAEQQATAARKSARGNRAACRAARFTRDYAPPHEHADAGMKTERITGQ